MLHCLTNVPFRRLHATTTRYSIERRIGAPGKPWKRILYRTNQSLAKAPDAVDTPLRTIDLHELTEVATMNLPVAYRHVTAARKVSWERVYRDASLLLPINLHEYRGF